MAPSCEFGYTGMASLPTLGVSPKSGIMTFSKQPESLRHTIKAVARVNEDRRRIGFMDLAVEIRLRIYDYVYGSHSVRHSKLPLWYLTQGSGRHVLKPVTPKAITSKPSSPPYEQQTSDDSNTTSRPPTRKLLSAHRPMNYIPTALLLACRQIYYEARTTPFHENEFVFSSWHDVDSSVQAARDFLDDRLCADWQRQSMRYVRIELDLSSSSSSDDIKSKKKAKEVWEELLCSTAYWGARLRGMRLCIDCKDKDLIKGCSFAAALALDADDGVDEPEEELSSSSSFAWIFRGLVKLRSLRSLDVEIKRGRWYMTNDEKVGWCRLLEELLNNDNNNNSNNSCGERDEERGNQKVSVMCAQTSYDPFNLEQVFGKISYPMMVWPLYAGF